MPVICGSKKRSPVGPNDENEDGRPVASYVFKKITVILTRKSIKLSLVQLVVYSL